MARRPAGGASRSRSAGRRRAGFAPGAAATSGASFGLPTPGGGAGGGVRLAFFIGGRRRAGFAPGTAATSGSSFELRTPGGGAGGGFRLTFSMGRRRPSEVGVTKKHKALRPPPAPPLRSSEASR